MTTITAICLTANSASVTRSDLIASLPALREWADGEPITAKLVIEELDLPESHIEIVAYRWAVSAQGFTGDFGAWLNLSQAERDDYELGAQGI